MNEPLPPGVVEFGTEGKWCLEHDGGISARCRETGRLDWDPDFRAIPEILALGPGDGVIDVGAYIGDSTTSFLRQGCGVIAFEPNRDAFRCLAHNCPDALCFNQACGNGERYKVTSRKGNMSAEPLHSGENGDPITRSLDSLDPPLEKLTYLKIDVEGFESRVLKGAQNTIARCRPILHIEVNPGALALFGSTPDALLAQIRALGYTDIREVYRYYDKNWDLMCKFPSP